MNSSARVVTLRTFTSARAMPEASLLTGDDAVAMDRFNRVIELMAQETAKCGGKVFITLQDRDASLLQSIIAKEGEDGGRLAAGGVEAQFGDGVTGGDVLGWARSLLDHTWRKLPIVRPADTSARALPNRARIAILSDWGTGLYGAPVSARSIARAGGWDLLLHLGDIYYSGTTDETKSRFLDVWPADAAKVSRALNGNHEMYSGGHGYFEEILPAFKQSASYFAYQNDHWLFVGLDTACTDHALDDEQLRWLAAVMVAGGQRKVILFSHHQPYSRLDKQGPLLQQALARLPRPVSAWYWGHEHACVIYDRHPSLHMFGRCVGNGGIPSPRNADALEAETERSAAGVTWRRLEKTDDSPSCLVLDGPNPLIPGEEEKFGPHGYVTLEVDGPALTERIHLPDGTEIFKSVVK